MDGGKRRQQHGQDTGRLGDQGTRLQERSPPTCDLPAGYAMQDVTSIVGDPIRFR